MLAKNNERAIFYKNIAMVFANEAGQSQQRHKKELQLLTETATVTQKPSTKDKINLFRDLFKGREDVYPKRFLNSKTGKSGYAPVCSK